MPVPRVRHVFGMLATVLLAFSEPSVFAKEARPPLRVGQPAPPITLKYVLQSPTREIPTWQTLKGKVVVLEFWATWCAPCIAALPHLNKLVEQFSGRPVEFVNVTDEDERHVREFLKFRGVSGVIGLDTDKAMTEAYGVHLLPRTVLVGPDGIVRGVTQPDDLTRDSLEALLAGQRPTFPRDTCMEAAEPKMSPRQAAYYRAEIRPASGTSTGGPQNEHSLEGDSWSLNGIISWAYSISSCRIVSAAPLPAAPYDFVVEVPPGRRADLLGVGQQMLTAAFDLKAHWESREMDVLVLNAPEKELGPFMRPGGKRAPEKSPLDQFRATGLRRAISPKCSRRA